MTEIELLKKRLAEANAEIDVLRIRLTNVTFLLKSEMVASGNLPKSKPGKHGQVSSLVREAISN
ncbi:MAG TPA: hypothetical protein VGZ93_12385 [Candidatus Methylacidiphilales bacterium]|jgi:hypothetical protein|nr:hypothetical protein [Candidatus Methylacidiphilales bacterium]